LRQEYETLSGDTAYKQLDVWTSGRLTRAWKLRQEPDHYAVHLAREDAEMVLGALDELHVHLETTLNNGKVGLPMTAFDPFQIQVTLHMIERREREN
jgi:hypothetical protein